MCVLDSYLKGLTRQAVCRYPQDISRTLASASFSSFIGLLNRVSYVGREEIGVLVKVFLFDSDSKLIIVVEAPDVNISFFCL